MSGSVLVVQSAARQLPPLRLDEELRNIQQALRGARYRAALRIRVVPAARLEDLTGALREEIPTVLHVSGRADGNGNLLFATDDGGHAPLHSPGLLKLIDGFATPDLLAVVLNTCHSAPLATELAERVGCAIGTDGLLDDTDAARFASEFYRNIGAGQSVGQAHLLAEAFLEANDSTSRPLPRLHLGANAIPAAAILPVGSEYRVPPQSDPVKPRGSNLWQRLRAPRLPPGSH
ncbi:hypothetical protein [Kitasatospora sp. NPDC002040]|uniref:hypothetical protein n=1 Tax=Kitasatospora sp. NPDC002040 TaxID=3154661 RepID=UPI00332633BC